MKNSEIAIIVFTYSRLEHTRITLEFLSKNKGFDEHPVFIYSDGPKLGHEDKVESVREYLKDFKDRHKNVKIIERLVNIGLEQSIITGITETLEKYTAVIVIEDDIRTSPAFLLFMSTMLDKYKDEKRIGSISGYTHSREIMKVPESYKYDIFFVPRTSSWGWATWRDRWDDIDWKITDIEEFVKDKEVQNNFNKGGEDLSGMLIKQVRKGIDTWDIQWSYHNFKKDRLTIYPTISYVENIGHDGTGVHCGVSSSFENSTLNLNKKILQPEDIIIDEFLVMQYKNVYEMTPSKLLNLGVRKVEKTIKDYFNKK